LIIALCAAISAAAAPLLDNSRLSADGEVLRWAQAALQQLNTCQYDVAYLVALGRVLRALGQPEEAAEHLERALLLAPQDSAALSAFAAALADLGDPAGAQQIRAMLGSEARPNESPAVRRALSGMPLGPQWRTAWGLSSGVESNLLGVSGVSNLTLTLPGLDPAQPVLLTLPLEGASQPRQGGYWQAQGSVQMMSVQASPVRGQHEDLWMVQASSRLRHAPSVLAAGYATAELGASHQRRWGTVPWGHHAQLSSVYLDSRTGVTYLQHSAGAGVDAYWGSCQTRLGMEWAIRRYPNNIILDGRQASLYAQAGCSPALRVLLRKGTDRASDANRPGGTQDLADVRARGIWQGWAWEIEWSAANDRLGYSPLLKSGTVREQARRTWRLERTLFQTGSGALPTCKSCTPWQAVVGLESSRRQSNLDLFKTNNLGAFLSINSTK
jgi:hypothetical protein